ncbi:MAG: hypothetical protein K9W43_13065 [Candidatus Thorarchaeota archaeon]|nr:hypothetical protein [Candidatus Thorarchaeota archaeon]
MIELVYSDIPHLPTDLASDGDHIIYELILAGLLIQYLKILLVWWDIK